jgi:hypothetical protein
MKRRLKEDAVHQKMPYNLIGSNTASLQKPNKRRIEKVASYHKAALKCANQSKRSSWRKLPRSNRANLWWVEIKKPP